MEDNYNNLPSAHFANEFAINGKINLGNAREWLIFLYLVAQLDPLNQEKLPVLRVAISDLKNLLKEESKRSGAFNERVIKAMERMSDAQCRFDAGVFLDGLMLPKIINIFSEVGAEKGARGVAYLTFEFNEKMKPLLLGLRRNFVGLQPPTGISSGHAISFLLYAKAERDRRRKHDGKTTIIRFGVEALKDRLDVKGKYPRFDNFKKRIIAPILKGVNKSGVITITDIQYEKVGRKIETILFFIQDVKNLTESNFQSLTKDNKEPTKEEVERLTFAQERAYKFLIAKGVYSGIAIRKIIPQMPSNICDGYEDYFCEEVYKIVVEKSNVKDAEGRASVLVDWFKKDIFSNDHFSRIIESVHNRKKLLPQENRANRELAKTMTANKFRELSRKNTIKQDDMPKPTSPTPPQTQFNFASLDYLSFPQMRTKAIQKKEVKVDKPKPAFEFNNWKKENPEIFKEIVMEKDSSFKELFKDAKMSIEEKKKTINNLIFAACKHYYDTH